MDAKESHFSVLVGEFLRLKIIQTGAGEYEEARQLHDRLLALYPDAYEVYQAFTDEMHMIPPKGRFMVASNLIDFVYAEEPKKRDSCIRCARYWLEVSEADPNLMRGPDTVRQWLEELQSRWDRNPPPSTEESEDTDADV